MPVNINKFLEKGYDIVPAENIDLLIGLRDEIAKQAKILAGIGDPDQDSDKFLNSYHSLEMQGSALNQHRVNLVKYCTEEMDIGQTLFDAFHDTIINLIGPDIVVQKVTNLVIQQPEDPDITLTHRDAPLNSPFEIIMWLPLVDVYGSKSMYVLDRQESAKALDILKEPQSGYEEYKKYAGEHGEDLEVPFGSACFFWPGLIHGCHINQIQETRWSLNIRYKNLFSPVGPKGLGEFFDLLTLSPLARIGLEFERNTVS